MGMDVYGRNPKSEAGKYFQVNVWSWRPIHELIKELCGDLFDEKMLRSLNYNDGAGPEDQAVCDKMVTKFEEWMEHHAEGCALWSPDIKVHPNGRAASEQEMRDPDIVKTLTTPYRVSDGDLKVWIEFLRNCGGFRVC